MTEQEITQEFAQHQQRSGMNINVNLPSWNSTGTPPQPSEAENSKKQRQQLYIAGGVLLALIIAIIIVSRSKK